MALRLPNGTTQFYTQWFVIANISQTHHFNDESTQCDGKFGDFPNYFSADYREKPSTLPERCNIRCNVEHIALTLQRSVDSVIQPLGNERSTTSIVPVARRLNGMNRKGIPLWDS